MTRSKTQDSLPSAKNSILADLSAFFTSVKTTILVLCMLAAASILGTLVPQDVDLEQLRQTASPFYYRLVLILDLHAVFRSWWFILLLLLLSANLLGCLLSRLPRIPAEWKGTSYAPSFSFSISDSRPMHSVRRVLAPLIGNYFGTQPTETRDGAETILTWTKHRVYLLAFPLMHLSIIFVLVGGLIGLMYGVKGRVQIREGEAASQFIATPSGQVTPLPFQIVVDKFTLKRYPTGQPQEFRSDVRLIQDGKEVRKGSILVNHPLTYDGISLFQADYRMLDVKDVTLEIQGPVGNASDLVLQPRESVNMPGTTYTLKVVGLDPGVTERGPGCEIKLQAEGEPTKSVKAYRSDAEPVEAGPFRIRFKGYAPLYATGLQIGYDPGTNVVWIGCSLLILGFSLTLFTNLRRTRVSMVSKGGKTLVRVSGRSRKGRAEFRKQVEAIVKEGLDIKRDRPDALLQDISGGKSL